MDFDGFWWSLLLAGGSTQHHVCWVAARLGGLMFLLYFGRSCNWSKSTGEEVLFKFGPPSWML